MQADGGVGSDLSEPDVQVLFLWPFGQWYFRLLESILVSLRISYLYCPTAYATEISVIALGLLA